MNQAFLPASYDPVAVALSVVMASFASYVALDLAGRVRSADRFGVIVWITAGAAVMGSGIWAMHFVGMLAFSLPIAIGYAPGTTALSWVAGVAVSLLALWIASRDRLTPLTLAGGAVAMGSGICAMHYVGMAALEMAPGVVWDRGMVAASALIAIGASAVALLIFFGLRRLRGARARVAQAAAALVMGLAISGMHYTGMAAAAFPVGSVCLSAGGLGGQGLGVIVIFSSVVLLSITLFSSLLDSRLQARATQLARSLQATNEQLQDANAELQRMAFHDPLTGVPNRTLFDDRLQSAIARADRAGAVAPRAAAAGVALLFIDLDGFKPINDNYGHETGDAVLRQVAARLRTIGRDVDTLARLGGDEFVMLLDSVSQAIDAEVVGQRVVQSLSRPYRHGDSEVSLSCSIGVAMYPEHGPSERLLVAADAAMYAAKRAGGRCCVVYEPQRHQDPARTDLLQALREAVPRRQLQLYYQPKIDSRSQRVRSVEALLRWNHPVHGVVGPADFIPLAERHGLIVPIGNWVIDEACRQVAEWTRQGRRLKVSINLSAYQVRQADLVERIRAAIERHGTDPRLLVCEFTESAAMEDALVTQRVIDDLGSDGIRLSIDDFGTGHSSLAMLRHLRVQELKIDRLFVRDVATDPKARDLVEAVVRLAHVLDMTVVAEGVETQAQRDALVALGCDELQGFYFGRPMVPSALDERTRPTAADHAAADKSPRPAPRAESPSLEFSPSVMSADTL